MIGKIKIGLECVMVYVLIMGLFSCGKRRNTDAERDVD